MMLLAGLMFECPSPLVRGEKVPKADEGFVFPPEAFTFSALRRRFRRHLAQKRRNAPF